MFLIDKTFEEFMKFHVIVKTLKGSHLNDRKCIIRDFVGIEKTLTYTFFLLENIKCYNISYGVTIPVQNIKIMTLVNSIILNSKYIQLQVRTYSIERSHQSVLFL